MTDMNPPALPESIGPYRLLRPIARGGMAEVYEVEDPSSGGHLALKLLVQTGGALARFNREYEAMIRLNHPNIVRVFHYGVEGESPWLTMELVDGTPIQAYAKRCGKPGTTRRNEEVVRLAHDLALALDHIHRRGLLHLLGCRCVCARRRLRLFRLRDRGEEPRMDMGGGFDKLPDECGRSNCNGRERKGKVNL